MPRALWLPDVLADEFRGSPGFEVEVWPGWDRLGSETFDPIGVMIHHTGPGGYDALLRYMLESATATPPPLCNVATSRPTDGVVRITVGAAGRANHAGKGSWSWTGQDGGNRRSIGIENQNTGDQPWPDQQLEAVYRLCAAILRELVRQGKVPLPLPNAHVYAVRHADYAPGRKIDWRIDHRTTQAGVAAALAADRTTRETVMLLTRGMGPSTPIANLQALLNDEPAVQALRTKNGKFTPLKLNGRYDDETEQAVRAVQASWNYPVTGQADGLTQLRLLQQRDGRVAQRTAEKVLEAFSPGSALTAEQVRAIARDVARGIQVDVKVP